MTEEWRPIEGHSDYRVSNLGNVLSMRRGKPRLMTPVRKANGYLSVNLRCSDSTTVRTRSVHSLVAEAFMGPRPAGMLVLHGDGNPLNNRVTNLRWGTGVDNWRDARAHGYVPRKFPERRLTRGTHCSRGHRFDRILPNGKQACTRCNRIYAAQYRARRSPATPPA